MVIQFIKKNQFNCPQRFMKYFLFIISTLLLTSCHAQQPVSTPIALLKEKVIDNSYPKIDAIIVQQGKQIIIEEYFNGFTKDRQHDTRSSFKSITSILAGIAIDKKLMSLDDTLGRFFPELTHAGKRAITVRNLLEMRSGLNCEEFYDIGPGCEEEMTNTADWVAYCLGVELVRPPGLNWSYNSNEPMIVGEIIARVSGKTVMDFAKENLFQPLGIVDYKWTVSPKGQGMTAGSFYMKPIDMLKIIDVVKNKGRFREKQIVSENWIKISTNCHIPIDFSFTRFSRFADAKYETARYGFFWYRERLVYKDINTEVLFASGNGGQYMMYLTEYNATAVFTGSNYGKWRGKLPFEILLKYIIPAIRQGGKR
jgi:CubicO group peptidase (beta-lactamase class C family)